MSGRRFVIPDIHGCSRTFLSLINRLIRLRKTDTLYLLGDLIDRGPRSKEVLETIFKLMNTGTTIHVLRGNHEEMMLRSCGNLEYQRLWMLNGGAATMDSLEIEDPCDIPFNYRGYLSRLPYYIEMDDCILVHAGLNCSAPDPFADRESMLWSRTTRIDENITKGKKLISGHTPVTREEIRASLHSGRIILDNGCVYADRPELGTLAALELDSMSVVFQKNVD
jgi:serine/threonine protein phosphatase 1